MPAQSRQASQPQHRQQQQPLKPSQARAVVDTPHRAQQQAPRAQQQAPRPAIRQAPQQARQTDSAPAPTATRSTPSPAQTRKPSPQPKAAKVETASEASSTEEESTSEEDTETEEESEEDTPKPKPAPKPEIQKPKAVVQKIPRTASPDQISDEDAGSPVDRRASRQLYASNASPDPRYLQHRVSSVPQEPVPARSSGPARNKPIPNNNRQSIMSTRQASSSEDRASAMPLPSSSARSRETMTRPLNIRKESTASVRQPSFYEPSSRPIRSSPPQERPRRPSAPKSDSEPVAARSTERPRAERRPSEGQGRRPSEGKEARKGSSASARRPSERSERV